MTVRLAWATDVHFNFPSDTGVEGFARQIAERDVDALVLSGDIGESHDFSGYLETLAEILERPIYFVLGNHDYYKGSIARTRTRARQLSRSNPWLWWLPDVGVLELSAGVGLLGHGGWADGRLGDYEGSSVLLNDYLLISDLSGLTRRARREVLHRLGDEAAEFVREHLPLAMARFPKQVVFVTHSPPFREACWSEGRLSNDDWLPHFSCGAVGEALITVAEAHPEGNLLVLCGHTHGWGEAQIRTNVKVLTAGARYGVPEVAQVFEL